jgi:outer membrane lipoprotein-sorting protein
MVSLRSHLAEVERVAGLRRTLLLRAANSARRNSHFSSSLQTGTTLVLRSRALHFVILLGVLCLTVSVHAGELHPTLQSWLNAQTNVHGWSAEVTQTRRLKTLTQPLLAKGRVWFAAPNRFRWQIGDATGFDNATNTIAVRQTDQLLVIYPRLKRAEKYPLDGDQTGPWKDTLALLEAGFPRSQADLESRFKVASLTQSNSLCEVALQPRSASARRLMPQIKIAFATNDFSLRATELQFADGSTMRNDFSNATLNPKIDERLFAPRLDGDYQIVEPLKK